jgi:hypothetical protein
MANNRIEIYQNNTYTRYLQVEGLDVTGYDVFLSAKRSLSDTSLVLDVSLAVIDASTVLINIPSTDVSLLAPMDYVYDITASLENSIYTITKDVLTILDGVRY